MAERGGGSGLGSGGRLIYDALVLATGARATVGVLGALTFRNQGDLPRFRQLLRELDARKLDAVVFAVPSGTSWPLPLYELALLSAARARALGAGTEITLVSPEQRPLAAFGAEASELVATELADRGVRFLGSLVPGSVCGGGALTVQPGPPIKADRVVAVPQLRGARIAGIPANRSGFVPIDARGRVQGMVDVYAAGDAIDYPIKHGGLATQQADRIAHTIAAGLGLTAHELKPKPVLEVRLIGGQRPLRLESSWTSSANQPPRASPTPAANRGQAGPRYTDATSPPTSKPGSLPPRHHPPTEPILHSCRPPPQADPLGSSLDRG